MCFLFKENLNISFLPLWVLTLSLFMCILLNDFFENYIQCIFIIFTCPSHSQYPPTPLSFLTSPISFLWGRYLILVRGLYFYEMWSNCRGYTHKESWFSISQQLSIFQNSSSMGGTLCLFALFMLQFNWYQLCLCRSRHSHCEFMHATALLCPEAAVYLLVFIHSLWIHTLFFSLYFLHNDCYILREKVGYSCPT